MFKKWTVRRNRLTCFVRSRCMPCVEQSGVLTVGVPKPLLYQTSLVTLLAKILKLVGLFYCGTWAKNYALYEEVVAHDGKPA